MDERIHAAIEFDQNVLRYAETEHSGSAYRLLRLGSCSFDFDVERELFTDPSAAVLKSVSDALADVLHTTYAAQIRVVVHAHHGLSFFSAADSDLSHEGRASQFLREARILSGDQHRLLHIVPAPLYIEDLENGSSVDWYHVTVTNKKVFHRLSEVIRPLGIPHFRMAGTAQSVASVVREVARGSGSRSRPFLIGIGVYDTHTEYILCRPHNLHFATFSTDTQPDAALGAASTMIERLNLLPEMVGRVLLFGREIELTDYNAVSALFGTRPEMLDPSDFLHLEPGGLKETVSLGSFVPCLGSTL